MRLRIRYDGQQTCALGPDDIWYKDIAKRSDGTLEELVFTTASRMLLSVEWLHSYPISLSKPGKDQRNVQGYRLITVHNKKITVGNMSCQFEQLHLLPPTLGVYRPNREIWVSAAVFLLIILRGIPCRHCDMHWPSWHRGCVQYGTSELPELHISPFLLKLISAGIFGLKVLFKCGTWTSAP